MSITSVTISGGRKCAIVKLGASVDSITRLITETKQYAEANYDRTIAFTANLYGLDWTHLVFADLMDYYSFEYPYLEYGYPPESQAIPEFKLARALSNTAGVALPAVTSVIDLSARDSTSTLMTIFIAEAYASRGAFMVWNGDAWMEGEQKYGEMAEIMPVCVFVRNNPYLYTDLESLARTAVLYSYPTNYFQGYRRHSFRGTNYALLDGQVQYDVVAMGDDIWTLFACSCYEAISAAKVGA